MCTLFIAIADKDGLQAQNYLALGNALGNMPRVTIAQYGQKR